MRIAVCQEDKHLVMATRKEVYNLQKQATVVRDEEQKYQKTA